jgi:hypothetical protein
VTGYESPGGAGTNAWTVKLDPDGNEIWSDSHDGVGDADSGYGIALDADGDLLVAGYETAAGGNRNIWIRRYSADGAVLWTETVDGPAAGFDAAWGVALDDAGDFVVIGQETVAGQGRNIWIRKYDADGNALGTQTVDGDAHVDDSVYGVTMDPDGDVLVAGYVTTVSQGIDAWVRKIRR